VVAAWTELPPAGGLSECAALVELADRLRWSAPELVVQYAQRALATGAGTASPLAVRAQAFVGGALARLGRYAAAVEPALAALRHADRAGLSELVPSIRLDLAAAARGLGEPLLGCAILRPVVENTGARPASRAAGVAVLVGCAEHVGRRDDLEDSLAEAERLLAADEGLTPDTRRIERALVAVHAAAYHRRYGETEDAVEAARAGLGLLTKLRDPALEGGRVGARLTLELVCALLDDGELAEAERAAEGLLGQPLRAAAADPAGRLMLAVANRVHVPAGRVERGRGLLGDAGWTGERYGLDWLVADALTAIAQLEESAGQPADALRSLRAARAAEYRQLRSADAARRQLMIEFGVRGLGVDVVNALLRNVVRAPAGIAPFTKDVSQLAGAGRPQEVAETDAATGLLTREGLSRRLQAVRTGNRPVALTLVRLDPVEPGGEAGGDRGSRSGSGAEVGVGAPDDALTTLAGRVRDIAPDDAELARSDGSELAVLLPHTTRDEAEEFAATIRESARDSDWLAEASRREVSISTGVAQSGPDSAVQDADSLLNAARETLTPADWDRPGPSPPGGGTASRSTRHQEIRQLLAPLLGHPSLTRSHPEPHHGPGPAFSRSRTTPPSHPDRGHVSVSSTPPGTASQSDQRASASAPELDRAESDSADGTPAGDPSSPSRFEQTASGGRVSLRPDAVSEGPSSARSPDLDADSDTEPGSDRELSNAARDFGDVDSMSRLLGRSALHVPRVESPSVGGPQARESAQSRGPSGQPDDRSDDESSKSSETVGATDAVSSSLGHPALRLPRRESPGGSGSGTEGAAESERLSDERDDHSAGESSGSPMGSGDVDSISNLWGRDVARAVRSSAGGEPQEGLGRSAERPGERSRGEATGAVGGEDSTFALGGAGVSRPDEGPGGELGMGRLAAAPGEVRVADSLSRLLGERPLRVPRVEAPGLGGRTDTTSDEGPDPEVVGGSAEGMLSPGSWERSGTEVSRHDEDLVSGDAAHLRSGTGFTGGSGESSADPLTWGTSEEGRGLAAGESGRTGGDSVDSSADRLGLEGFGRSGGRDAGEASRVSSPTRADGPDRSGEAGVGRFGESRSGLADREEELGDREDVPGNGGAGEVGAGDAAGTDRVGHGVEERPSEAVAGRRESIAEVFGRWRTDPEQTVPSTPGQAVPEQSVSGMSGQTESEEPGAGMRGQSVADERAPEMPGQAVAGQFVSGMSGRAVSEEPMLEMRGQSAAGEPVSGMSGRAVSEEPGAGMRGQSVADERAPEMPGQAVAGQFVSGMSGRAVSEEPVLEMRGQSVADERAPGMPGQAVAGQFVSGMSGRAVSEEPVLEMREQPAAEEPVSGISGQAVAEEPGAGMPGESVAEEPPPRMPGRAGPEQTVPRFPEREPEIVFPEEEPDDVPPSAPGQEPTPEVPEAPTAAPKSLRRERTDTTSIADLLTEALVAYQETSPEEDEGESAPPAQRGQSGGSGRHRMPDWDSV
jgi:GGDEF domain-containing protein